jgi:hypothetical protein
VVESGELQAPPGTDVDDVLRRHRAAAARLQGLD